MKKLLFTIVCSLGILSVAFAQYDAKAKAVLDAMSTKYRSMASFKADFSYTMQTAKGSKQTFSGTLTVKNDKFQLVTNELEVINNGSTVWTYNKRANEVNITNFDSEDNEASPAAVYSIYKKGYKYKFIGEKKEGTKTLQIIELYPEKKNAVVSKVRMNVNKTDKLISSWEMYQKDGTVFRYNIKSFKQVASLSDTYFAFNTSKYKGIEVNDLR